MLYTLLYSIILLLAPMPPEQPDPMPQPLEKNGIVSLRRFNEAYDSVTDVWRASKRTSADSVAWHNGCTKAFNRYCD